MRALGFAWRSLVRQPARALLGVAGIAAVGALLFDMLLLSQGLVVSLRRMLDGLGFDVRVIASETGLPGGPPLQNVTDLMASIAALPEVDAVVALRIAQAGAARAAGGAAHESEPAVKVPVSLLGATLAHRRPWRVLEGRDLAASSTELPPLLVGRSLARELGVSPGDLVVLYGDCAAGRLLPPPVTFRIAGIASFPFKGEERGTAAAALAQVRQVCGEEARDEAALVLVASHETYGPDAAVTAIRQRHPDIHAFTNEEVVARFRDLGFSYFRQISAVLASITLFFGFLLIGVLLTVSVNQRLGEIAALRALGLTRRRVVADVVCESILMVGAGGVLALPLGAALSVWLDRILRGMPGIPADLHFFVFQTGSLALYGALLTLTAILAAAYPMWLVARLPIAATLRAEVVS